MLLGYVRCSTDRQQVRQQCDALKAAGCKRIYKDKAVRATAKKRPALLAIRKALRPQLDTFVVVSVDRAFRSTVDAITFLDDLTKHEIRFRALYQNIDPNTLEGRKWYIDMANNAEYERGVISRRTREAMAAAKRRGAVFGRKRKLSSRQIEWARKQLQGKRRRTMRDISRTLKVCPRTLKRALRQG